MTLLAVVGYQYVIIDSLLLLYIVDRATYYLFPIKCLGSTYFMTDAIRKNRGFLPPRIRTLFLERFYIIYIYLLLAI